MTVSDTVSFVKGWDAGNTVSLVYFKLYRDIIGTTKI